MGYSLVIRGCGRTVLPDGDAGQLFGGLMRKLLSLPDGTLAYRGHEHQGRWVSCMAQKRASNSHFSGRTRDEFVALMAVPQLPKPTTIDAVLAVDRHGGKLNPRLIGGN